MPKTYVSVFGSGGDYLPASATEFVYMLPGVGFIYVSAGQSAQFMIPGYGYVSLGG